MTVFQVADVAAWRALAPDLTIGSSKIAEEIPFSDRQLEEIADGVWRDGYLQLPPLFNQTEMVSLRSVLQAFRGQKLPPVFIYLYDQPWHLFSRLNRLLKHFLGKEFAVLPNLWAWHLEAPGDRGWPLHRDCDAKTVFDVGPDKILMSLSLWLPLTDADEDNGCMSVLPRSAAEKYQAPIENITDIMADDVVVLPAKAGSVLGWAQDLYHWGGKYSGHAKNPRMSLSLEFQNRAFDPLATPVVNLSNLPTFEERLALVEDQFDKYRHIDPMFALGK